MQHLSAFRQAFGSLGYGASAIIEKYVFSDVLAALPQDRTVGLAAFTQTPPSYRNAAIAVVADEGASVASITPYRALGAPLIFSVSGDQVTGWQIRADAPPRVVVQAPMSKLEVLFDQHREVWAPLSIHRAKAIGHVDRSYQLDFVDAGLMPAIEGEIHGKLDRAIAHVMRGAFADSESKKTDRHQRSLFQTIFRLLAAKVLLDRGHDITAQWDGDDIGSVLGAISTYYGLPTLSEAAPAPGAEFARAWRSLRDGISFRNIAADDLAFVYEQTLVTPETRKHFGTHSTPRQVAEHVVTGLELWKHDPEDLRIYEPFAGAGVLLVAALRQMRDLLPVDWSDNRKHTFLVKRVTGDEIDAFAAEVATLSLILADYPNANGWKIEQSDLFADDYLGARVKLANVIVCNPPFESFTPDERARYPEALARSASKPIAVLDAVLDARPLAIGFVLPEPFIRGQQYAAQRRRLEKMYGEIDLVALPDRTFNASVIRSSLLIARSPREQSVHAPVTRLSTGVVRELDRDSFLSAGRLSLRREEIRPQGQSGDLWIEELSELWTYLAEARRFESVAIVHRGIEWQSDQASAVRNEPAPEFVAGVHSAAAVRAYAFARKPVWLDTRPDRLLYRAIDLPWSEPKLLANAARVSRGPWSLGAAIDCTGLVASQQLFGIWRKGEHAPSLRALAALLNGPLGAAYIASHSPPDRIRVSAVRSVPLPRTLPAALDDLVEQYVAAVGTAQEVLFGDALALKLQQMLNDIDEAVLRAYDLPPKLERELLAYFRGAERPTVHAWRHWWPDARSSPFNLSALRSQDLSRASGNWITQLFRPLPADEARLLREALDDADGR